MYFYRIIEYASFVYLDANTRTLVRKALSVPHVLDNLGTTSEQMISIISRFKSDDYARMDAVLKETVHPSVLWKEIDHNRNTYSSTLSFDGGFSILPIISTDCKESEFTPTALTTFVKNIREIRNALSHGKDQKTSNVIQPSVHNFKILRPWVSLICAAAGEVILYRDAL